MNNKNYVIIMAAGHGTRMGSKLPKQFMSLGGKAILQRTIMKFADACPGIKIITVLPPDGEYENGGKITVSARIFPARKSSSAEELPGSIR